MITEKEDEQSLIINGKREGWFDKVYNVTFTDDGKRFAYIAGNGGKWDEGIWYYGEKWFVVVDGKKSKPYDQVYHLYYPKEKDTFLVLAIDGKDILLVEYTNNK